MVFPCKRLSTFVVLFSFYFQTLWPCVVFASDAETLGRSSPPISGFTLRAFVDDSGEDFDSHLKNPTQFPDFDTVEKAQEYIDEGIDIQDFYPALQITVEDIFWSKYGFNFLLDKEGTLFVKPQEGVLPSSKTLRIYNPHGPTILGEGIILSHLLIQSQAVIQTGQSSLENLEAWVEGDEGTDGIFLTNQDSHLKTSRFTVHKGSLVNKGMISVAESGAVNLNHQNLSNEGILELGDKACVNAVKTLENGETGTIQGKNLSLEADTFINHHLIHSEEQLALKIETLFHNQTAGSIVCGGPMILSGPGDFLNEDGLTDKAGIAVDGHVVFESFKGSFTNKGSVVGCQGMRGYLRALMNHKNLAVKTFDELTVDDFLNTGTIQGNGTLILEKARNKGFIKSDSLILSVGRSFSNEDQGMIQSTEGLTLEGQGTFLDP